MTTAHPGHYAMARTRAWRDRVEDIAPEIGDETA